MRIPRVFTDQTLTSGSEAELDEKASHHLSRVLRLKAGDGLILFNGRGGEYRAVLTQADKPAWARVEQYIEAEREPPLAITLIQGVSRGERMDYTLQKGVELGIDRLVPVTSARSVVRLRGGRAEKRRQRWRDIVRAAAEQSGRNRLPSVAPIQTLSQALSSELTGTALLLVPDGDKSLPEIPPLAGELTLLAGPEGGLNGQEIASARQAGFTPVRLGPRTLRTETAGIAALAIIQALWGDLGT